MTRKTTMKIVTVTKPRVSGKTAFVIAIGLLVCCSFSLRARLASSPPVLLSTSSGARRARAEAEKTDANKHGDYVLWKPSLRWDRRGGDGVRRSMTAVQPGHPEEVTGEHKEAEEEKTAGVAEETEEEKEEDQRESFENEGQQEKTGDQGANQTPNTQNADTLVEDDVEVVLPSSLAAANVRVIYPPAVVVKEVHGASGNCWVFVHLQKSGGSTMKEMLMDRWKDTFCIFDDFLWKRGDKSTRKVGTDLVHGAKWNVVAGGHTAALRRVPEVEHNCHFFTLFRHPISRIVSAYLYCKIRPNDNACASEVVQAKEISLLAFAKHWGNFAVRQFAMSFVSSDDVQTYIRTPEARAIHRHLILEKTSAWFQLKMYLGRPLGGAGSEDATQGQTWPREHMPEERMYELLRPVQELIKDGYTVGILEEWNTTLALLGGTLDMADMDWSKMYAMDGKQNVNRKFEALKTKMLKQAWTDPELKQYIQLDILLYEHAVDVFHEQARSHGVLR